MTRHHTPRHAGLPESTQQPARSILRRAAVLRRPLLALLPFCAAGALPLSAASISPGNLLIYRVGDGSAALNNTATSVFLDEYTNTGALVQSIPLASTGASALTAVGNATTEGIISRSQDGTSLIFTGYRKDAGGANPSADAPTATSRVIGTVGLGGVASTAYGITDSSLTGTIRSATSVNGTSDFYVSTSAAVRLMTTATTSTLIDARNSRQVNLSGNTLYASNGSTAITGKIQSYGTLPTVTTPASPVVSLGTADAINSFVLFDLDSSVAGDDTLYTINAVGNTLLKYSFDGTAWNANGSIPASGTLNVTGVAAGGGVSLFLTSGSGLFAYSDATGYNGALAGTLGTAIATAGTNTAFRGIGMLAIPEPSTAALAGLALAFAASVRRRKVMEGRAC